MKFFLVFLMFFVFSITGADAIAGNRLAEQVDHLGDSINTGLSLHWMKKCSTTLLSPLPFVLMMWFFAFFPLLFFLQAGGNAVIDNKSV